MKFIYTLLVGLIFSHFVAAQTTSWQQQYLNAKDFYKGGKYALAMEAFKPIIESEENAFSAYSSFYYALAAYHNGYKPLSKDMLLQVKAKYPKWSRNDEVNYWLGLIYFEEQSYNQGLNVLSEIEDERVKEDVKALKYNFYSKIETIEELKSLFKNNGEDRLLGYLLAKRISQETLVNQDQKLLREIIEQFDLNPAEFNAIEVQKTVFKDSYKVAVLLPFMTSDLEPNLKRKVNQFVLDLYQGIQLAADTLKTEKINIELYAYDTKRSKRVTKEIVGKEELKGMDLIIGPLFSEPIAVVNEFAYKRKINVINPLSSNSGVIGQNPFAFLFFPSNETVGRLSAEFVSKNVKNKSGIILYEDNPNDSAMAFAYKQRIMADSIKIIRTKRIKKDSSRLILDMLLIPDAKLRDASTEDAKEAYEIKLDSVGHIFVASSNDLISSKVLSAVETRGDSIVVIGSSEWLNLPVIKYDTYFKLGCMLYAPNYNREDSPEYRAFRKGYIRRHKEIPGKYAEIGYELMQLMGRGLNRHGKYFQLGWRDEGFVEGHLTAGFNYTNSNDNLVLPLLQFDEGQIKMVLADDENRKK
ncbi:MAG: ABC transporter substrate-binding protein [Fulvivirga sp.]|uniref:ABC transporter substrate-binding protein n=1 Tax=Fulvivirga sp. TaxID=1931237 RepID=UPI0032EB84E5